MNRNIDIIHIKWIVIYLILQNVQESSVYNELLFMSVENSECI